VGDIQCCVLKQERVGDIQCSVLKQERDREWVIYSVVH